MGLFMTSPCSSKGRKRISFESNLSSARKLDLTETKKHKSLINIEIVKDAILDHASRRIQIFYYQSVAYYGENCHIFRGKTEMQHGTANHTFTQAAHSSLLPNLLDDFFETIYKKGSIETAKLIALGVNPIKIECHESFEDLFQNVDTENGLINEACFLNHSSNATVELPADVNEFDNVLEYRLREKALKILNQVSNSQLNHETAVSRLNPYEATIKLANKILKFLNKSENETRLKISLIQNIINKRNVDKSWKELKSKKHFSITKKIRDRSSLESYKSLLQDSLKIIALQRCGTRVPLKELLSGKVINGVRIPLTDEELFIQKLEIIKRSKS